MDTACGRKPVHFPCENQSHGRQSVEARSMAGRRTARQHLAQKAAQDARRRTNQVRVFGKLTEHDYKGLLDCLQEARTSRAELARESASAGACWPHFWRGRGSTGGHSTNCPSPTTLRSYVSGSAGPISSGRYQTQRIRRVRL